MAKKELTKKELVTMIEVKVQELNLLQSALKTDKSRKPETLEMYKTKYKEILSRQE